MATIRTFNPNPHNMLELRRALQMIRIQLPPSTYDETGAPTATDDISKGWRIGSKWIDESADNIYECADNTENAAVWKRMVDLAVGAGGVAAPTKGGILVYDSAAGKWKILSVGTDDQMVIADSAETLGLRFGLPPYTPAVPADWEDTDPTTTPGALDRVAGGHAGVCLISDTKPTTPGNGQVWLDTSATGSAGTGVSTVDTITTSTTLTTSNTVVLCDASMGPITVTLPAASGNSGRQYIIKKIDSSAFAVTIDGNASETIDGDLTAVITSQYESVSVVCDASNWHIY